MIKIGIIGLGNIIENHLDAIFNTEKMRVEAVCDTDPARLARYTKICGCKGFTEYREMLGDGIDVAVICTPHALHASIAEDALRAGCHVVVEKPMAVSVPECNRMLTAASAAGRHIIVAETASFHPGAVMTGSRFAEGKLGKFLTGSVINAREYFTSERPGWFLDPLMSGGGMFGNVGLHRLARARACLPGLKPVSVSACVGHMSQYKVEACTTALVRYANGGAMAYEEVGYFPRPVDMNTGTHLIFEKGIVIWSDRCWSMMERSGKRIEEALQPADRPYAMIYRNLLCAVRNEVYGPKASEYAEDVSIVQGAYRSAARGEEIRLDDPEWMIKG